MKHAIHYMIKNLLNNRDKYPYLEFGAIKYTLGDYPLPIFNQINANLFNKALYMGNIELASFLVQHEEISDIDNRYKLLFFVLIKKNFFHYLLNSGILNLIPGKMASCCLL